MKNITLQFLEKLVKTKTIELEKMPKVARENSKLYKEVATLLEAIVIIQTN